MKKNEHCALLSRNNTVDDQSDSGDDREETRHKRVFTLSSPGLR